MKILVEDSYVLPLEYASLLIVLQEGEHVEILDFTLNDYSEFQPECYGWELESPFSLVFDSDMRSTTFENARIRTTIAKITSICPTLRPFDALYEMVVMEDLHVTITKSSFSGLINQDLVAKELNETDAVMVDTAFYFTEGLLTEVKSMIQRTGVKTVDWGPFAEPPVV